MRLPYLISALLLLTLPALVNTAHAQASSSQNYVMTNTVKQAGITNEGMVPGVPIATQGKSQSIAYFDGLGRPLQTVMTQAGASGKDIIAGNEYDIYGREIKRYLPYADINNTATPGGYRTGWQTIQASFYNGLFQGVDADAAPYSQSVLEPSPLNRVQAQGAPGTVWQPNLGNAYDATVKTIQVQYLVNAATDNVRIFNVDPTSNAISSPGTYATGLLTNKTSIDEHGGITKEFTDETGQLILKQVYTDVDTLQTYYIYDNLDLLRAVIQPEGVAAIPSSGSWTPATSFINSWMFLYNYDYRNRMIMKQVPGASPVTVMYDQWDRVACTQDGNMLSTNTWLFTKYDALNRPIVTGTFVSTSQSTLQSEINAANRFETVSNSAIEGYTLNGSFPSSDIHTLTVYTTTHYDSYSNLPSWNSGYTYVNEDAVASYNNFLQGQVVATQTKILGTSNFLRTVSYYDDKYRSIQSTSDNSANGIDRITKILSFDGKPTATYESHTSNVYSTPIVTTKNYTYDQSDRVLAITHQLGTGEIVTLAQNAYNELGQLLNKEIHQSPSHPSYLQKLDYSYNIRGWLNGVNQPYSDGTGYDETDLFSFQLHYNITNLQNSTPEYNGNISEQVWKGGYDEYLRGYEYTYDKANRLKMANYGFKYYNGYQMIWDFSEKYNENVDDATVNGATLKAYDRNGNIGHLERFHGSWNEIDDLFYDYTNSPYGTPDGNHLHKVSDWVYNNLPVGFTDQNGYYNDYDYDNNGNLLDDYNKGITSIVYNYLNLPTQVNFGAKGNIAYLYDAAGNKMQKTVTDQSVSPNKITITKYAGAFVYTNSYLSTTSPVPTETLEFISHEEGRIRPERIDTTQLLTAANTKYIYDYFMKDHLGNTRMVLTTEQQTDFYAATMETANATKENQLFQNMTPTAKPSGFDNNSSNAQVAKLNGSSSSTRVGPSIILKVEAGDIISVSTKAWYTGATQAPVTGLPAIESQLLTLLTNGITANGGTHNGAIPLTDISNGGNSVLTDFLSNDQPYNSGQPKAFLNWIIVDEEFKEVKSSFHMGAVQVPLFNTGDTAKLLNGPTSMTVRRNGWLYVYVSNESNQDVYFDNLAINQVRGPVVEANNYYPFGLEIPGLNSKAIGFGTTPVNRKKYNGGSELQSKEFSDGSGLETYDTHFRQLDPQTGRWWQIDPKPEMGQSLYAAIDNNPVSHNDILGDSIIGRSNNAVANRVETAANNKIAANKNQITANSSLIKTNAGKLIAASMGINISAKEVKNAIRSINKLGNENSELQNRNGMLNEGIAGIQAMRSDVDHNYSFESPANDDGTHHVTQGEGKNVIVEGSNDGLFFHEGVHVLQSLNSGGLRFSTSENNKGLLLNIGYTGTHIGDEVKSYQVQFSFDRSFSTSFATKLSDINAASVRDLHTGDFYPYKDL